MKTKDYVKILPSLDSTSFQGDFAVVSPKRTCKMGEEKGLGSVEFKDYEVTT